MMLSRFSVLTCVVVYQAMAPQSMMFPGLHPMAMMSTSGMGYSGRGGVGYQGGYPAPYPPMYQGGPPPLAGGPPGGDASVSLPHLAS